MKKIAKFTDLAGRTVGVIIDAETPFDPTTYTSPINGRIKKVKVLVGGIAATTLIENGYIKLTCVTFGGVDMYAPFEGIGLETVPRTDKKLWITECDLKVLAANPIKLFYYHNVLPTTPEITVFLEIEG